MMAYLVYVMIYNCFMNELLVKRDIDVSHELIQLWYPTLWKHKAPFHIYYIVLEEMKKKFYTRIP